jgi:RNA-directed DNA polymerase
LFVNFLPAVSNDALKAMSRELWSWRINRRSDKSLGDLACMFKTGVQGWLNYDGRFYKSELYPLFRRMNDYLVRWAKRKYKRLRGRTRQTKRWLARVARREPTLFAHWRLGVRPAGWTMGAV